MTKGKKLTPARARRAFMAQLGLYVVVITFLLILNLITSPDSLWFYWPALGWGLFIAISGVSMFVAASGNDDDAGEDRPVRREAPAATETRDAAPTPSRVAADVAALVDRGTGMVDDMRRAARRFPTTGPRTAALEACAAMDRALSAIADYPNELPLAQDFVDRLVVPAHRIVTGYQVLASRDVPSARATLERVERQDLPLLTRRADETYDRLHRGSIIDLEVARDMLRLDMPDADLFDENPDLSPRTTR